VIEGFNDAMNRLDFDASVPAAGLSVSLSEVSLVV
jgi:hypothetical protein